MAEPSKIQAARLAVEELEAPRRRLRELEAEAEKERIAAEGVENLKAIRLARKILEDHLAELQAAQELLDQAAETAFECWRNIREMAQATPGLVQQASAAGNVAISNPACPLTAETIQRLRLI